MCSDTDCLIAWLREEPYHLVLADHGLVVSSAGWLHDYDSHHTGLPNIAEQLQHHRMQLSKEPHPINCSLLVKFHGLSTLEEAQKTGNAETLLISKARFSADKVPVASLLLLTRFSI